ncbi:MAG: enoyl-CoA hydratase/carnithine racemase [Paraglaciecola sp.]|jgi:enoyl-CoA hydratase/carnithine racemase
MTDDVVIFEELLSTNGMRVGHATLNKVSALNALNIDMIRLLMPKLEQWQQDPAIAMVVLDGVGDKAFCAGGDVVAMHDAMLSAEGELSASLQSFFTEEYQLDYLIHRFAKPFVVWGNGIVMGGGLGLMSAASHRIVTASSRIAMPEISIGLYPDVGGSWFLNKMPKACGLFLGLTGASINAADALYVKLADYYVAHEAKALFLAQLAETDWHGASATDHKQLNKVCETFHAAHAGALPAGNVQAHQEMITPLASANSAAEVAQQIAQLDAGDDKWLSRAQKTLQAGSPLTAHLVYEQLKRGKGLSLAECFKMELIMSCRCGEMGEFQEGVRALLIDKDMQPNWRFKSIGDVPQDIVEHFFSTLWPAEQHPLYSLGTGDNNEQR